MSNFIYMETDRLVLRDHTLEDIYTHHALISNEEVMYYLQDIKTTTMEESRVNLQAAIEEIESSSRERYYLRIEDRLNKEHIGEIGYTVEDIRLNGKHVNLGYFIHKKYWGKGYVTEAVKRLMQYAFLDGDVYFISTGCIKENGGSESVMKKCGMIKEADNKISEWHDKRLKERVTYRLLKEEWIDQVKVE